MKISLTEIKSYKESQGTWMRFPKIKKKISEN